MLYCGLFLHSLSIGNDFAIVEDYTTATQVTVALPVLAASSGTILRWRQLNHSGHANDEWALDDITITGSATYILYEDFYPTPLIPYDTTASRYSTELTQLILLVLEDLTGRIFLVAGYKHLTAEVSIWWTSAGRLPSFQVPARGISRQTDWICVQASTIHCSYNLPTIFILIAPPQHAVIPYSNWWWRWMRNGNHWGGRSAGIQTIVVDNVHGVEAHGV